MLGMNEYWERGEFRKKQKIIWRILYLDSKIYVKIILLISFKKIIPIIKLVLNTPS